MVPNLSGVSPTPDWVFHLLHAPPPEEGAAIELGGTSYLMRHGILRAEHLYSDRQDQTARTFGFKWSRRESFDSDLARSRMRDWLIERYGDVEGAAWWSGYSERPLVLDAGCGAGLSALELFGARLKGVRYLGSRRVRCRRCRQGSFRRARYRGWVSSGRPAPASTGPWER